MWLPYVRDPYYPHKWDEKLDILKFKRWLRYIDRQGKGEPVGELGDVNDDNPEVRRIELTTLDYMIKGEYLQQFQPFFGPKERLDPLSKHEVETKEKHLTDEIEAAIR